ncbi:hypothetical protein ACSMXN_08550 [Jatrophihabitans sp. DSM 45814]
MRGLPAVRTRRASSALGGLLCALLLLALPASRALASYPGDSVPALTVHAVSGHVDVVTLGSADRASSRSNPLSYDLVADDGSRPTRAISALEGLPEERTVWVAELAQLPQPRAPPAELAS